MRFYEHWNALRQSGTGHGIKRLVYPDHHLNLWILFTQGMHRCFQIEIPGIAEPQLPALVGFDTRIEYQAEKRLISFELSDNRLNSVFDALLVNLIEASSAAPTEETALTILFERLALWTELLKKRVSKVSIGETIGLLGELIVLERLLNNWNSVSVIVGGWRGPNGDATDIGIDDRRIEIKAKLSTQHLKISISSADQLTSDSRKLFLAVAFFGQSESGISVNHLVQQVRALLSTYHHELDLFESKLIIAGYQPDCIENDNTFDLVKLRVFEITNEFPRIQSNELRVGISRLNYDIELSAIEPYECHSAIALTLEP